MATVPTPGNDDIAGTAAGESIAAQAGNDLVRAGGGNDTVHGDAGNDKLFGEAGNDRLWGGAGNDEIDGGAGIDTAVFSGNQAQYQITTAGSVTEVKDLRGQGSNTPDGIDKLVDVERLVFADGYRLLAPDQAPDAVDDAAATNEDAAVTINVLANDTDPDGDTLTIASLPDADADAATPGKQTASGATISIVNGNGQIRYDPTTSTTLQALNAGQTAAEVFRYTLSDGFGGTDEAKVQVTVSGAADLSPRSFDGQTIDYTVTVGGRVTDNRDVTVGSGIEISYELSDSYIDLSTNKILFRWLDEGFYFDITKFVFFDERNVLNDFQGVSLTTSGVSGLDESDISFDANTITINFQSVQFISNSAAELGVTFA